MTGMKQRFSFISLEVAIACRTQLCYFVHGCAYSMGSDRLLLLLLLVSRSGREVEKSRIGVTGQLQSH